MSDLSFSQYQEAMKPFFDLIKGIVHIIGYENKEKENEINESLITQIMLSVIIMHISQENKGKDLPDSEEIKKKIEEGNSEEILSNLTAGITQEILSKYLSESTTLVMTNYYFEVKDQITPEKTEEIKKLYQEISEGINRE
ncbi:MAG: nucleotidyltransferase family protein [Candidatus Pacebacteria bacterium]|nr:nucleotidyltransferase family protein [Candidatus Paceibacterota bacterium]